MARDLGITRARVCQCPTLLRQLPAELLARVEVEKDPVKLRQLTLRKTMAVAQAYAKKERRQRLRRPVS